MRGLSHVKGDGLLRRQFQGLFDVHFHDARHAFFLHGHAYQLLGHFHGEAVVRNVQKLRVLAHLLDQTAEARGIGIIERRIHFVQQTKRRRIEAEQGKHQ